MNKLRYNMNVAVRYLPLVFQFGAFQGPLNLNNAYFECDILLNTRTVASFDGLVIQAIYHLVQGLKCWLFYNYENTGILYSLRDRI